MFARIILPLFVLLLMTANLMAQLQLDAGQQERAENLFAQLRCVVCQNQSILESNADVAKDLRVIVSEQIAVGRTDSEIKTFLVDRYGEFILLRPVFEVHTAILWVAPILFLSIGTLMFWRLTGNRASIENAVDLSEDEKRRIEKLLASHKVD